MRILTIIAVLSCLCNADQPRENQFWSMPSASGKQLLVQWYTDSDEGRKIHWKVLDSKTGDSIWGGNPDLDFLPFDYEVFLAPDGHHLAVINSYVFFRGGKEELSKLSVVWLFDRDKLIRKYDLEDVGVGGVGVKLSVSHAHPFPNGYNFREPSLPEGAFVGNTTPISLFGGTDETAFVTFRNGRRITFEFKTGKTISSELVISEKDFEILGDRWYEKSP